MYGSERRGTEQLLLFTRLLGEIMHLTTKTELTKNELYGQIFQVRYFSKLSYQVRNVDLSIAFRSRNSFFLLLPGLNNV
jgi:hypothetical protein